MSVQKFMERTQMQTRSSQPRVGNWDDLVNRFLKGAGPRVGDRAYTDPRIVRATVRDLVRGGNPSPSDEDIIRRLPTIAWGPR